MPPIIKMAALLESGTSVSHYRVIGALGAGGMGEVYKAHDSNLDRAVALKVLPPDIVRNDERVRRFIQEAKAASSLNHPHIVTIHEIGQADVPSSDDPTSASRPIHYIAMELIDGLTLKRKIHQEETDLRTLLGYLAQAAEGLAKAHAAGIVHRDLKPENIMVTRDGYAKVLDFGLAKLSVRKSADEGSTAPTEARQTREGAVMGTVGYMSPEQVQGKVVDHRSDIFSFGCILYEATTRQRPFDAESDVDIMHKILHDKPAPIEQVAPGAPAELRRMIRRCLAKEPEKRYQSMKDLALELSDMVEDFEQLSISSSSAGSSSSAPAIAPLRRTSTWLVSAAILVAVIATAMAVLQWRRSRVVERPLPPAFESMRIDRLTNSGNVHLAAISPDGKYVAHAIRDDAGKYTLLVRQIATSSDVHVVGPLETDFIAVSFSPDGNYLYYVNAETAGVTAYSILFRVPALGGTPKKLIFDVDSAPSFSPDGSRIVFVRGYPTRGEYVLMLANSDGSGERKLATFRNLAFLINPAWSPDGKHIVFVEGSRTGGVHTDFYQIDAATGARQKFGRKWRAVSAAQWLPDGSALVIAAKESDSSRWQIWVQPYPTGDARRVTNDLNDYVDASLTADGKTLVTLQASRASSIVLTAAGDEGGGRPLAAESRDESASNFSASARGQVVYQLVRGTAGDIWILDRLDAAPRQLTNDGVSGGPAITADGSKILFNSRREGGVPHAWSMDVEGSNARQMTRGNGENVIAIAPNGTWFLYFLGTTEVWKGTAEGASTKFCGGCFACTVSPDSRSVAYAYYRPGERLIRGLRVAPVDGGTPRMDIAWPSGFNLRWTKAGDGLTYEREINGATNIWLQPLSGGSPRQLTRYKSGGISSYAWLPDGKLILSRVNPSEDAVLITKFRSP